MYDRILELAQRGKVTSFEPFADGGIAWTPHQLDEAVEAIDTMEPFDIAEVADFAMGEANIHYKKHDAPMSLEETFKGAMMRLPFPSCWFEFVMPPGSPVPRMAAVAREDRSSPSGMDFALMPLTLHTPDGGVTFKLVGGDVTFGVVLDEDGVYQRTVGSEMSAYTRGQVGGLVTWVSLALYAIHLLHWRDVTVQAVAPSKQMLKRARRTGQKPPVEYKILKIEHWVKKYRSVTLGGGGWEQRWHTVIGHRQTWTESAPQFGCEKCKRHGTGHPPDGRKTHVGTWWIDAGFAGNKELGEIVKTYEVEPPVAQLKLPLSPSAQPKSQSGRKTKSAAAGKNPP